MAKKSKDQCSQPDPSEFDKVITFLRCPDELTNQEIETRDWRDWTAAGKSYAKIHTSGSRAVYVANQTHQQIDVVIECPWNSTTSAVSFNHAIKRSSPGQPDIYLQVMTAINVDFNNNIMRFLCRNTEPNGAQESW